MKSQALLQSTRCSPLLLLLVVLLAALPASSRMADESAHRHPPGTIIDYAPAAGRQYLGSPSLAILPDGRYVASHDLFGPGSTRSRTVVFTSADRGRSWARASEIEGQWWSSLFYHRGALYILGTSREYGAVVIRRSRDGGRTWTEPRDRESGLLIDDGRYHTAPVPVVIHRGRIWRAMEDAMGPGGWGSHFRSFVMSAAESSDLLRAENWRITNRLGRDPQWLGGRFGGWLEGNVVITPEGRVVNILRADYRFPEEKAAMIEISDDGATASFDPATGFIDLPGGCKKFTIRYDTRSRLYWSLVNYIPERQRGYNVERTRNTVALVSSPDLRRWQVRSIVLYHPDPVKHAFQYLDWQFEGDDIVAVARTAHDDGAGGAHNQHDANFMTFHRIANFRRLAMNDSPAGYKLHYQVAHGWPELPGGKLLGHVTGVGVNSRNEVFVFRRAENSVASGTPDKPISGPAVFVYDAESGRLIDSWGEGLFILPHGLAIDGEDNVWLTDVAHHQVFKFDRRGKLLMTIGERGVAGADAKHFDRPTDVAVAKDGSIYVSDGYGNSRVAKFSAAGEFLLEWGRKGTGPGEFDNPHSIALDGAGRVYVADRYNDRVQIFDERGRYLKEWKGAEFGRPWAVRVGSDGYVYVVDGGAQPDPVSGRARVVKVDGEGCVMDAFGRFGNYDGQFVAPHALAVGRDGAIYVGDVSTGMRVQKFARR